MTLYDAIAPFLDRKTGLMTAGDGGTDNLILMSAYLCRELRRHNETEALVSMRGRMWGFLCSVQVSAGLYRRLPGDSTPNSMDNLVGACAFPYFASEIRYRWNRWLSCFDVNNPAKIALNQNFYGRFIGLKAFIVAAAGDKPNLIQRLMWMGSCWFNVHYSSGASDPLLMSLQVDTMRKFCPMTCAYWDSHFSVKQLYAEYFGASHPFVVAYDAFENTPKLAAGLV